MQMKDINIQYKQINPKTEKKKKIHELCKQNLPTTNINLLAQTRKTRNLLLSFVHRKCKLTTIKQDISFHSATTDI